jgi:hypothetical protein
MQLNFDAQGVNIIAFTGYAFIFDEKATGDLTAAVNSDLMNALADKLDPSILDAANAVTDIANSMSTLS